MGAGWMRRAVAGLAVVAGVAIGIGQPAGAGGAALTASGPAGWVRVPTPSPPYENYPKDVTGVRADDVWMIGHFNENDFTLAEHWDGKRWTLHSPTGALRDGNLFAGAAIPGTDQVWAVGVIWLPRETSEAVLIVRWDGSAWKRAPIRGLSALCPGECWGELLGVAAFGPHRAVAAGYMLPVDGSTYIPMLLRLRGNTWVVDRQFTAAMPPSTRVFDVAGASTSDLWAAGDFGARHWNGRTWTGGPLPPGVTMLARLSRVQGTSQYLATDGTVVVRYDGSRWVRDWQGAKDTMLWDVGADGPTRAWAVGERIVRGLIYRGVIVTRTGTGWTRSTLPGELTLSAVSHIPGSRDTWAIGWDYGSGATVALRHRAP